MRRKSKLLRAAAKLAGGVFAVALMMGINVCAKEVTVSTAAEFLEAVEEAKNLEETLTVTVTPGCDFTLERFVRLYSDTVINADGATIRNVRSDVSLFAFQDGFAPSNIIINGGTWEAGSNSFINLNGAANITVKGAKINGSGTYLAILRDCQNVTLQDCTMNGASILIERGSGNAIKGGTISGTSHTSIQIKSDSTVVDGTVIADSGNSGIEITDVQNVRIMNVVIRNSYGTGIDSHGGGNHTIKNNKLFDSGFRGISVISDQNSIISGNTLDGSAVRSGADGEGLVVDERSKGTQIIDNTIQDTKGNKANIGNGIIVNRSENITVSGNTVSNSNNHGIQVSYNAKNVTVIGNKISASGRMGISVTRGAQADLKDNNITGSVSCGITFDGSKEGRVSGSVENCIVTGSGEGGIWIEGANVSVSGNTVSNSGGAGIIVKVNSTVTADNNKICQESVDDVHGGIQVLDNSELHMNGNIISNFGLYGVYAEAGSKVLGSSNQVNLLTGRFGTAAYNIAGSGIQRNGLSAEIGRTEVKADTLLEGSISGVVIDGKKIETTTNGSRQFTVTFAETDPSNVIVYTQDADGNAICLQAPANYSLRDNSVEIPDDVNMEEIRAFVSRLYTVALNRDAEEKGLEDWTNRLATGQETGAEVAQGFFFSEEFTKKNLSDEEYVDTLYRTMFDRPADEGGKAGWLKDLYNGASREYVYHGFAESDEFANLCKRYHIRQGSVSLGQPRDQNIKLTEFVSRVYYIALVRESLDEAGINDWCSRILGGGKPADVVWGIVFSKECANRGLNDEEFVTMLYKTYFDRDAAEDRAGFNDWVGRLREGASREDVVNGFSDSEEFANLVKTFGL